MLCDRAELAKVMGVPAQRVKEWVAAGLPRAGVRVKSRPLGGNGRFGRGGPGRLPAVFDVELVKRWLDGRPGVLRARKMRGPTPGKGAAQRWRDNDPRRVVLPAAEVMAERVAKVRAAARGPYLGGQRRGGGPASPEPEVAQAGGVCLRCGDAVEGSTWCGGCRPVARALMERGWSIVQIAAMDGLRGWGCGEPGTGGECPELGYKRASLVEMASREAVSRAEKVRGDRKGQERAGEEG